MLDLKKELNPSQYAAVTAITGPVLVIAGAGSGKTRVVEYRVLNLVQNNVDPKSILLLTFTRRAARQMLDRAEKHDAKCRDVTGGTFHSFCYMMLKKYAKVMGFSSSFSILTEADAEEAIRRCCLKLKFYEKEKRFPRKDTLRNIISASINKNVSIEEVVGNEYPHFLEYADDIKQLRTEYARYKIDKSYLDYDDLLLYLKLLLEKDEIRKSVSERYRYIMVDEYQDTNKLQSDITYLLSKAHGNVMVVGDDAQSIYGFRGASHENIMKFPDMFPECKIIKLEENYRSTQSILDVSNSVMENMKNKYSKCLRSARKVAGERPQIVFFRDAYREAEWVAGKIKELRDEGCDLSHQAVLFRSAYISIPLQAELSKRNIPYQVFGGLKFYETGHVRDMLAHLKVIANLKDELGWMRLLMLIEGIGPKTSERICDEIVKCDSFDGVLGGVFQKYNKGYKFCANLARLKGALKSIHDKKLGPGEQFERILDYYSPILQKKFDNWHVRLNDLETLKQISSRYNSLEELLADFAIEPPEKGVMDVEPGLFREEKPLTLSTIHSAKGLEWGYVFLIGLMEGVLPVSFALDKEDESEEEHRLFYVAVTRAKNELFLSMHHEGVKGGINRFNRISSFVDMPNVLSKLDQNIEVGGRLEETEYDGEEMSLVYDKDALFRRVIDCFE